MLTAILWAYAYGPSLYLTAAVLLFTLLLAAPADQPRKAPPMKLTDVRSATKSLVVSFDAGDLKVTYRPNTLTAGTADKINAAMADPSTQLNATIDLFQQIVAEWDLEADDGKIIDIADRDLIRDEVPVEIINKIFTAVQAEANPGKADGRS